MKHYLWELRPYMRQVAGELVLGSISGILMNTLVVLPPIVLGRAIDAALAFERGQATSADVAWAALLIIAGVLATEAPRIGKRWWLMTANARIRANLRADALRGVLGWPLAQLHTTPIGDLMARIIGDVETLGVGVREFIIETWDTLLFSLSLVVALFVYDPGLSALALLTVPAAMLLAQASGRWVRQRTLKAREANSALTSALQERLQGIRVLRLFGRASAAMAQVEALSRHQADTNVATTRLREGLKPVYTILMMAGVLLVVWLGGQRVIAGAMTIGAFVAYLELYLRFVNRGFRVPQLFNSVQVGGVAYARLRLLLAPALAIRGEPPHASFRPGHIAGIARPQMICPRETSGPLTVSLRNVTFRYPDAASSALNDVSLDIPAGALIAVTGPVGSGKSALARALLGCYPLESGDIWFDGQRLADLPAAERAARLGYLPQEPFLFSGSVRENVAFGAAPTEPALNCAVERAALAGDVRQFPAGLDTEIGELGIRVSGGQRQRIALARAMIASPGLLVLDDPFSAVDVDTEARLIAALREAFGPAAPPEQRATILLCSHRLAIFPQADGIVVLDGGRIVEQGTHAALLERGGLYARIYRAQGRVAAGP